MYNVNPLMAHLMSINRFKESRRLR